MAPAHVHPVLACGTADVESGTVVVVVVVCGTKPEIGGTVVVVVLDGVVSVVVVVIGGGTVVVGGDVVVVVLTIGLSTGEALGGKDCVGVPDEASPRRDAEEIVMSVLATCVVVVVLAIVVGTVVVPYMCSTESVGDDGVSISTKAHTAPLTASTATMSATPGCQTPSR